MANTIMKTTTNYFHVKDEQKFIDLIGRLITDGDAVEYGKATDEKGVAMYYFCYDGCIDGIELCNNGCLEDGMKCSDCSKCDDCEDCDDREVSWGAFLQELSTVIADGDAAVITTVLYEKLRYIQAYGEIVTSTGVEGITLSDLLLEKGREMLKNPKWSILNYV